MSENMSGASAAPSGLSRRQLVRAGVWAAPVIVLATASPAAAAASTDPGTPGTTHSAQAIQPNNLSVYDEAVSGRISGNTSLQYQGNAFGNWPINAPATATVVWRVVAVHLNNGTTTVIVPQTTSVIAKYNSSENVRFTANGLTPGDYTVRLELIAVTFSPNPAPQDDGTTATFSNPLTSFSTSLRVT